MDQGSGIAVSCSVGPRRGSDLALLWLWHRLAATTLIGPLAWEPPYAADVALERQKDKKKKSKREKKKVEQILPWICKYLPPHLKNLDVIGSVIAKPWD